MWVTGLVSKEGDRMRLAVGALRHRSNSFSSVPTNLDSFEHLIEGSQIVVHHEGAPSLLGGVLAAAADERVEIVPLLDAATLSGAPLADETLTALCDRLCAPLHDGAETIDGIILYLSGAMSAVSVLDADAHIVAQVRAVVGNEVPIAVALDCHANMSPDLVAQSTLLSLPSTCPEIDPAERGRRLVASLVGMARQEQRPVMALRTPSLLIPLPAQGTSTGPFAEVQQLASELAAQPGVLSAGISGGFPYADVPHAGASVLVITDGDADLANRLADQLETALWERRAALQQAPANIETAIHHAIATPSGPVLLADTGDDPAAGAPGDGTGLLWGLLDLGAKDVAFATIVDPDAVAEASAAGVGSEVSLTIGAKRDRWHGYPIDVVGRVLLIRDEPLTRSGPIASGRQVYPGRTVVLQVKGRHEGEVSLILAERRTPIDDPAFFSTHGIDVSAMRIVVVKSSLDHRAGFAELVGEMIPVASPGVTVHDFAYFPYQRLRRPIFPLAQE